MVTSPHNSSAQAEETMAQRFTIEDSELFFLGGGGDWEEDSWDSLVNYSSASLSCLISTKR